MIRGVIKYILFLFPLFVHAGNGQTLAWQPPKPPEVKFDDNGNPIEEPPPADYLNRKRSNHNDVDNKHVQPRLVSGKSVLLPSDSLKRNGSRRDAGLMYITIIYFLFIFLVVVFMIGRSARGDNE